MPNLNIREWLIIFYIFIENNESRAGDREDENGKTEKNNSKQIMLFDEKENTHVFCRFSYTFLVGFVFLPHMHKFTEHTHTQNAPIHAFFYL